MTLDIKRKLEKIVESSIIKRGPGLFKKEKTLENNQRKLYSLIMDKNLNYITNSRPEYQ